MLLIYRDVCQTLYHDENQKAPINSSFHMQVEGVQCIMCGVVGRNNNSRARTKRNKSKTRTSQHLIFTMSLIKWTINLPIISCQLLTGFNFR